MLIKCSECGLQVSDKAVMCPHCGLPMTDLSKIPVKRSKKAHKRLPNGFGQITEIKGKALRKPFRAMITVGKTPEGRPICKILKPDGYFATYNEAYEALVKYNSNPYDLDQEMTMQQLYEKWIKEHSKTIKPQSLIWIERAWSYCNAIHTTPVRDIRTRHIKGCVENGFIIKNNKEKRAKNIEQGHIKSVLNMLMDYAVEYELTDRNYARNFSLPKDIEKGIKNNKKSHISFSDDEMKTLWKNITIVPDVDIVLIQCYTGFRPQELCNIKLSDVNLDKNIITGGMKTDAGTDRIVPIHSSILDLIRARYDSAIEQGYEYLFNCTIRDGKVSKPLYYYGYKKTFANITEKLGLNPEHRLHDPRKQFVTMAKKYNMDEYAIKYLVGHSISDITEKVYTDRSIDWLRIEIEKIKVYD